MRSFVIMFLVLFFASCASISEKDCVDKECLKNERQGQIEYMGGGRGRDR